MKNKPGNLRVPYALAVHDDKETQRVTAVLNEHRTNTGKETEGFEKSVAGLFGKQFGVMVNSGSSGNLLAFEILNLPQNSEVITPLLTFSTTIAPLIKKNLIPVFADVEEGTYIINLDEVESLITKKTKALMIPLLLGNVPDMQRLRDISKKHKLYLIEDSCDTLGATFNNKPTGIYSDISVTSFFGSHIITAGGAGGMILVDNPLWRDKAKVLRGWGRSSSIFQESEDLNKRFGTKIDAIPYDAKFIFEDIGYNFLPAEICSAFGNAQIEKLDNFRKKREQNFNFLYLFFSQYDKFFILPKQDKRATTQWLAFPLTIRKNAPFSRLEITKFLETNNIQTRPVFTGNILRQPGFKNIRHRIIKKSHYFADEIMERGFVVGCHQGLEREHLEKLSDIFSAFLRKYN